jgi:hypothetical protein
VLKLEWGHLFGSPPLVLLFLAALIACVVGRRTVVPWLVLPAAAGAIGVMIVNPADTVFRYELPVLPAFVMATAFLLDRLAPLLSRSGGTAGQAPRQAVPEPREPQPAPAAVGG